MSFIARTVEKAQAELSKARADLFARDPNALAPPKPTEPVPTTPSRKKKKSASVTAAPAPVDADKVETQRLTEALERKEAQLKDAEKKASTLEGELAVVKVRPSPSTSAYR